MKSVANLIFKLVFKVDHKKIDFKNMFNEKSIIPNVKEFFKCDCGTFTGKHRCVACGREYTGQEATHTYEEVEQIYTYKGGKVNEEQVISILTHFDNFIDLCLGVVDSDNPSINEIVKERRKGKASLPYTYFFKYLSIVDSNFIN